MYAANKVQETQMGNTTAQHGEACTQHRLCCLNMSTSISVKVEPTNMIVIF